MTRARAKRVREALQGLVMEMQERDSSITKGEPTFIHLIQASKEVDQGMGIPRIEVALKTGVSDPPGR